MKLPSAIRPYMLSPVGGTVVVPAAEPNVQVAFPADLLADIEIYARSQSSPSRSEAIRQLLRYALVKKGEERR